MSDGSALWAFDLAGTLFRDDGLVMQIFRDLAGECAAPVDDDWILRHMGMQKRQVFREMTGREDVDDLLEMFDDRLLRLIRRDGLDPLPAADATLEELRSTGARLGYTTGFSRQVAEEILGHFGWRFDGGAASDEVERGRPAPDLLYLAMDRTGVNDPARVVAVGDTPRDLYAGRSAGASRIIGVCNGTHTRTQLVDAARETGAELIESLAELQPGT